MIGSSQYSFYTTDFILRHVFDTENSRIETGKSIRPNVDCSNPSLEGKKKSETGWNTHVSDFVRNGYVSA